MRCTGYMTAIEEFLQKPDTRSKQQVFALVLAWESPYGWIRDFDTHTIMQPQIQLASTVRAPM
jgi:hypothetical protein